MPRRDPVAVLARLRGIGRDEARRALAEAQGVLDGALAAQDAVERALAGEASGPPELYAAWLPAAARARRAAAEGVRRAEAGLAASRAALVVARAEAEATETLLEARRAEARAARLAAGQALLDDLPRR